MDPDRDLVPRALAGEKDALEALVPTYRREVESVVIEYIGPSRPGEIDDAVQIVWMKLFARIDRFDPTRGVKFSTWLYALARNQCLDILKQRRIPFRSFVHRLGDGDDIVVEPQETNPVAPHDLAAIHESMEHYRRAREVLTPEQRRVFEMHAAVGLEFSEIARRRRIPLGTAKTHFYRALAKLRAALGRSPRAA